MAAQYAYVMKNMTKTFPGEFSREVGKWRRGMIADITMLALAIPFLMFASQQIRSQPNCPICSTPFVFFCSLLVGWQLWMRDGRPSTAHGRHQGRHERHGRRPGLEMKEGPGPSARDPR